MLVMTVNWLAVFAATFAAMIVGALWYGPLFGAVFMQATGMDTLSREETAQIKKNLGMVYFYQFIGTLVMMYVLAVLIKNLGMTSLKDGVVVAFLTWVGFVVPLKLSDCLWTGGKKVLFWLGAGNMLCALLAAGAILGLWK